MTLNIGQLMGLDRMYLIIWGKMVIEVKMDSD